MLESGSSLAEVQRWLGHTTLPQTATYLASSPKAFETAIDRLDAHEQQRAEARQVELSQPAPRVVEAERPEAADAARRVH